MKEMFTQEDYDNYFAYAMRSVPLSSNHQAKNTVIMNWRDKMIGMFNDKVAGEERWLLRTILRSQMVDRFMWGLINDFANKTPLP